MKYLSSGEYLSSSIVFLAEIEFAGRTYRFSSFPLSLADGSSEVFYAGKLNDPDFSVSLTTIGGIKRSTSSISLSLIFPFSVAKRELSGETLDRAPARIYYVLSKNGQIQQSFEDRVLLYRGVISEPVFGHPGVDVGYVEFSIENEIVISDQSLLRRVVGENVFLEAAAFSRRGWPGIGSLVPPVDPDGITDVLDPHQGKVTPVIIGAPGNATKPTGETISYGGSPAYLLAYQNSGTFPAWYIIAGHPVRASTVKFYDNKGNSEDNVTVHEYISSRGQVYSYVILETGTSIDRTFVVNNDLEYWLEWDDGGGLISPDTGRDLSGGGDLLIWALDILKVDFDREAFSAVRSILNQYKFSGYINNEETKIFEFLQQNIVRYLPVSITTGARGLTPIIDNLSDSLLSPPRIQVEEGPEWERISPVSPENNDIVNDLTIRFAPRNGDDYTSTVKISYRRREANNASYEIVSPFAILSYQRYGEREQSISLDYVSDRDTAIRIGQNMLREKSLPQLKTSYRAAFRYGYLELGDVIEITDADLGIESYRVKIVGKRYDGASWLYDILLSSDAIINRRIV
jgi:hypothetical protein